MQEIHPIGGGGGSRIFGGGDRRLRQHHHNQQSQALKCPRCDSLNTKFCYYNNYNLSQPRHFCKCCCRYWTKGGVLRNVPVGGGCRKPKRSKPKPPLPPSSSEAELKEKKPSSSSRSSSSESSSLTAATTAATTNYPMVAAAILRSPDPSTSSSSTLLGTGFPESRFCLPQSTTNPNPNFETATELIEHQTTSSSSAAIFPDFGGFTTLMSDPAILSYNVSSEASPFRLHPQNQVQDGRNNNQNWQVQKMTSSIFDQELKMQEITARLLDRTVQVEPPGVQNRSGNTGLLPPLDWQSNNGEQGLFDLLGTIDQSYWINNQWTTNHNNLS